MAVKLTLGLLILSLTACGVQRDLIRPSDIKAQQEAKEKESR